MHRRAGSAPCPPPPCSVGGAVGGRGGGWQAMSCLGDLERGRGDLWQVNLAGHTRGWIWHVSMARHFGGSVWRVSLTHLFGRFHKQEKDMLLSKKRNRKAMKCIMVNL
jgi:hypothetical protein